MLAFEQALRQPKALFVSGKCFASVMVQQMTTDPRKLNFAARVEIMRMQNGGIIDQPTAERLFTALEQTAG